MGDTGVCEEVLRNEKCQQAGAEVHQAGALIGYPNETATTNLNMQIYISSSYNNLIFLKTPVFIYQ